MSVDADRLPPSATKLRLPSKFKPWPPNEVYNRLGTFCHKLEDLFSTRQKVKSNLLPFQRQLLDDLMNDPTIMICDSDKGLVPVAVDAQRYFEDRLTHLLDPVTYKQLSPDEAAEVAEHNFNAVKDWTFKHRRAPSDEHVSYIRDKLCKNEDPFGYFYALYKIHKNNKTRPVNSECTCLLFPLGQ